MFGRSVGIALIGVFLLAFSAHAEGLSVEGIVKDRTGRPIKGADVYIQGNHFSKVVKTDANGHYRSDVLVAGNYKVSVLLNGSVQASMVSAETSLDRSTKLNFELNTQSAPAPRHKHMVWIAPEIGTHIGGGSWVEVDDKNERASHDTASNVKKMGRNALTSDVSVRNGISSCTCFGSAGGNGAGLAAGRTVSSLIGVREVH